MEHINVTPEMRARVLERIRQTDLTASRPVSAVRRAGFRRFAALAACLAVVLAGALTLPDILAPAHPDPPGTLLPAGPAEASSAAELSALAGFPVSDLSELPFTPEEVLYSLIGDLAQIDYRAGEDRLTYRKGPGEEDISGDYNLYEQEETADVGGVAVTLRGNDGLFYLATWSTDNFSFSLSCTTGLEQTKWEILISEVLESDA